MAGVTVDVRGRIPKAVLLGHVPSYKSVATVFKNTLLIEYISLIYLSYLDRSQGSSDELGQSWRPLTDTTIKIKQWLANRDRLGEYLAKKASSSTLRRMPSVSVQPETINIRSGKLLAAHFPPYVGANGRLYPNSLQDASVEGLHLHFSTDIGYEDALADLGRPIMTADMELAFTQQAIDSAIDKADNRYTELLEHRGLTRNDIDFRSGKKKRRRKR